jgi:5'-deoxynucleotidase YfbR-like HD superfamily hydrolase
MRGARSRGRPLIAPGSAPRLKAAGNLCIISPFDQADQPWHGQGMTKLDQATSPQTAPERAWQRMLSGRRLNLLDPSPLDIEIEDIAVGLARVARWNGQTSGDWALSVAQHSLLVERLLPHFRNDVPTGWRLLALLHDAPEYVVGDLITPFKAALGGDYVTIERRLMAAVRIRFGIAKLPKAADQLIKRADRAAAYLEATKVAGFPKDEARRLFDPRGVLVELGIDDLALEPCPPTEAERGFLARFSEISERFAD